MTQLTIPPRAREAGAAAHPLIESPARPIRCASFYYIPESVDAWRPAQLLLRPSTLSMSGGAVSIERSTARRWVGDSRGESVNLSLTLADWEQFIALLELEGVVPVSHCLFSIVAPAIRDALGDLKGSRAISARWRAIEARGRSVDLLELTSYLRDSVAPLLGSRTAEEDPRITFARTAGRGPLMRLAREETLGLSNIAHALIPTLEHPRNSSEIERKTRAIEEVWVVLAPMTAAVLGASPAAVVAPKEEEVRPSRLRAVDDNSVAAIERDLRVSTPVARVLAARGLDDPEEREARIKMDPDERSHNPYLLKGMSEAADRLRKAIVGKQKIHIFGDYDADGIPGTALLSTWLRHAGGRVTTQISRREHGYGLLKDVAAAIADAPKRPDLVITIDCGTSNHEGIRLLADAGIDTIVLDHHLALQGNPPTPYFVNPMRSDGETYPEEDRGLCGCAVAYKMVQALSEKRHEPALYDLVAISTLGDQMPMSPENRFYITSSLLAMRASGESNLGVRALAATDGRNVGSLTHEAVLFSVVPRINAVGRMHQDPNDVVKLLMSSDGEETRLLAEKIDEMNKARRTLTDELAERAINEIGEAPPALIVAYLPGMPVGVAGLIASKVVEHYGRPAIVVNEKGHGSGRAPAGMKIIDLVEQLAKMPGLKGMTYGGHAAACGVGNANPKTLVQAARNLKVEIPESTLKSRRVREDALVTLAELTPTVVAELEAMSPYLIGEPAPRLRVNGLTVAEQSRTGSPDREGEGEGRHLRLVLTDEQGEKITAYWWGEGARAGTLPKRVDLIGAPFLPVRGKGSIGISVSRLTRSAGSAAS